MPSENRRQGAGQDFHLCPQVKTARTEIYFRSADCHIGFKRFTGIGGCGDQPELVECDSAIKTRTRFGIYCSLEQSLVWNLIQKVDCERNWLLVDQEYIVINVGCRFEVPFSERHAQFSDRLSLNSIIKFNS